MVAGSGQRPVVERRVVAEGAGRHVGEDLAVEALEERRRPGCPGSPPVTRPTTADRTSHRRHTSSTRARSPGRTMASIRSWLSEVMTS